MGWAGGETHTPHPQAQPSALAPLKNFGEHCLGFLGATQGWGPRDPGFVPTPPPRSEVLRFYLNRSDLVSTPFHKRG